MNKCKCGCGQFCQKIFVRGHNKNQLGRIPWNKGCKTGPQSEEVRKRTSEALKGRKISDETIRKILATKMAKRPPQILNPCECGCGEMVKNRFVHNHHMNTDEYRTRHSQSMKGRKITAAQLDNLLNHRATKKNGWSTPTKYKGIQMRSKLEARYAKSLDKRKIKWVYEPERFWLDELECYYIPDFYLPETNTWSEVKGWEQGLNKVDAFRKLGHDIKVIRSGNF